MPSPKTPTVPTASLPEVLRSGLIAGVVTAALEDYSQRLRDSDDPLSGPHQDILEETAREIRAWHASGGDPA